MTDTGVLLRAARDGDRPALDALLARHSGRLLAFVRVRMGEHRDGAVSAEDVVQESLVQAARKLDRFEDGGGAAFYRWLVAIAQFKISEARRARAAGKRAAVGELAHDPIAMDVTPQTATLRSERGRRLRLAVASLPTDQADAVRMRYLEGRSVRETAQALDRSDSAVKALVSRALDALSRRLTQRT